MSLTITISKMVNGHCDCANCKDPIAGWIPLKDENNTIAGRFDLCAAHKEQFIQEEMSKNNNIGDDRIIQNN
jgi:hypothetical protein